MGGRISPADETLLVGVSWHCNLACVFCLVEDMLHTEERVPLADLPDLLRRAWDEAPVRRVVLSGGEVTMDPELPRYAEAVRRALPRVAHVRVQTNAVRLRDAAQVRALVDAGVDELFVSIHGGDEATCDAVTARPGSFAKIVGGLDAIAATAGVRLLTNTAICSLNVAGLTDIVELVAPLGPAGMDFWNLWPRLDKGDSRELFAPVARVAPSVQSAVARCEDLGIQPVVKWVPYCLLGDAGAYLDNSQPRTIVDEEFWDEAPRFSCLFQSVCHHAPDPCEGLPWPYIRKFGWEEKLLQWQPRRVALGAVAGARVEAASEPPAWLDERGLVEGAELAEGWVVSARGVAADHISLELRCAGVRVGVQLLPADASRKCFATAGGVDIVHDSAPPETMQTLLPALRQLVRMLEG